ncbi:MAG: alpha/beta hydrolase [Deltaproteobacteria bacterium]|nr:alpha/beta hydrolase [Deltaproteobacteria bacterium]
MVATSTLAVDGIKSELWESGPHDRDSAVVFVHGNPGPKDDWAPLIARLSPQIRAVAPDMPGYGHADRPKKWPYTVESYAVYLGGLLDQLGVQRAHLVLHDFGGPWGLQWAAEHKDRVGSLTLINTGVLLGYTWHKYARIWQTPVLGELFQLLATKWALRAATDKDNGRPLPREFYDRVYPTLDWGQKRAVLRLYRNTKDIAGASKELAARLQGLDVPVLVVWGDGDPYLPARFADVQREVFPQADVHHLDNLGHWPFVESPERVGEVVVPFLERVATR